ncbi:MAG: carbohydrate ABC transporter permease [Alphaproteobacteria bacterium]|nr:carbohydrate ABC transporter permease [Alphaproteobacteria bacterium]
MRIFRAQRRPSVSLRPTAGMVAVSYSVLVVAAVISLVPFLYILSTSLKETNSLFTYPPDWIPSPLFRGNYDKLLAETRFLRWTLNTLFVGLAVTSLKLIIDAMAAYALAKLRFFGREFLVTVFLLAVAVPVTALIIPLFFIVRAMGLLDTYWALILPALANPLGILMLRSFIVSLPDDLMRSARLDGAGEWKVFTQIVLPLIRPGLVVHAIFTFMLQYTSFLWPLVAVQADSRQVLTVGISSLRSNFVVDWGLISAASLLATVPVTLLFLLLQRFFLAQNLSGALKG